MHDVEDYELMTSRAKWSCFAGKCASY